MTEFYLSASFIAADVILASEVTLYLILSILPSAGGAAIDFLGKIYSNQVMYRLPRSSQI